MDSSVKRRDTTKGPPLRILSLDGGGVRGYSMLILLQELMHRTFVETEGRAPRRNEIPKPCDHFDLIAGTGTGGLIAIMLGRLRLDLETCKSVYVRMTKRVFETDKTIAGIPYRSTLFKASKLEEVIRECVREHTIYENEGNDSTDAPAGALESPISPIRPTSGVYGGVQRSPSNASRYSLIGATPVAPYRGSLAASRWGDPNALLYDTRENRTKTAVTAVYKGTPKTGGSVLLRSYDSRKEVLIEPECTIWQAGRATAATGLAFKHIQIGQSVFLDEGAGKYNPSPQILDEAVQNEWPGREVGVFVSIGTGKRPSSSSEPEHLWWEGFLGGGLDSFAEARRRLIAKIEGCETTHQYMLREHLSSRHVNPENYYRLNVEVGVGEFGMNEWGRLSEISTNTRRYLEKDDVQTTNFSAAAKLAKIHFAKQRWERALRGEAEPPNPWDLKAQPAPPPPSNPLAVELPAEDVVGPLPSHRPQSQMLSPQYHRRPSEDEKYIITSDEYPTYDAPPRPSTDYAPSNYSHSPNNSINSPARIYGDGMQRTSPPPLPPKTPLNHSPGRSGLSSNLSRPPGGVVLPYPDTDGPPPTVNMARKPNLS
ncbi:FabD/lysophospholipase-like protein [Rhizodiscina lignyota]|uniref:FabD/lysophospholipase-like protein n=1 Tax=Rhizodiscina lignyota TaxID=1504668 RepID=A0A9P4M8C9_9PEZI|nr:FabD/lysophospholipase-like protein [Rhizodiscina lignyota]